MSQNQPTSAPRSRGVSRRNFLAGLGAAGAGGLVVGGAGGYLLAPDGSGASSGGGGSASGKPIKVGLVAPVTGPYSGDGQEMSRGAQLGVEAVNDNGGVGGRPLQLVTADVSDLSPENYVKAAQRLTSQEKVAAVFSGYCSNDSSEFRTYADSGVPMFHFNTLQDNVDYVTKNNITNIYEGCPTEIWYGRGFVPLMQSWIESGDWKPSAKSAAVVTSNDAYSISIANALAADIKKIGWTVPVFEQVTAPTADWGPVLSKIRSTKPGLIFVTDYIAGDLASFAKQFATAPTQSLLYQQYGPSVPEYLQLAGDAGNGVIWSTTIGTLPDRIGKAFLDLYQKKFNAQAGLSQAGGQYDIIRMWAGTAALAGDPHDFEKVNKLLKTATFRGVNGIYRLTSPELEGQLVVPPYPDLINDASLAMPHLTYQIQDGKQVAISPAPYASGKLQLPPWLA
jgi:branched-chain amino acid transport system substrate-binding protein